MKNAPYHILFLSILSLLLPALFPSGLLAANISVQAQLQPTRFAMDQNARLTLTVTGASSAEPEEPRGDELRFFSLGQSTRVQWINGTSSSSVAYTYRVQATRPGAHTIAPIAVTVDGKTYKTKAINCTVSPAGAGSNPPSGQPGGRAAQPPPSASTRLRSGKADQIGFMRLLPKKETVYAGELIPFTIKAYFHQGMRVTIKSNPRLTNDNFVLESMDDKPVQSEEMIGGVPYTLLTWHGSLSAVKQGIFPLEMEMDTSLLVRSRRQRPFSMFDDPFFDDFFGGYTQKDITLLSPKKDITVNDLPRQGKPVQFSGAIGSFSLAVNARPLTVAPGDPITLHMIVQGNGNFDRVKAPVFTGTRQNWKTYPPSAGKLTGDQGIVKKEFEQAIIPTNGNIRQIPAVDFTYFDPDSQKYIRLHSNPIDLTMQATAGSRIAQPQARAPRPQLEKGQATQTPDSSPAAALAPIHTRFGRGVTALQPLYRKRWFQLFMVVNILVFLTALALLQRRRQRLAHPERIRKKQIIRQIDQLLAQAKQAMQEKDSHRFLIRCRKILQVQFGFAWKVEPKAISAADLEHRLGKDSPLTEILKKSEHAAYSGETISDQEMQDIYRTLQEEVEK
ncbi:MAG: hypothetical protein DSY89_01310 [Deltaproteobacteria bacterium]|nr:MAG: hypothetical protein DSY89_01310 [Deltaproteobacteria bacterium]